MSKIFNRALMIACVDMADCVSDLSEEDNEIRLTILARENRISRRCNELAQQVSLSSSELDEFNELLATEKEFIEIRAQHMTTEQLESYVNSLSEAEESLPCVGKLTLQLYRETLEKRKAK